MTENETLTLSFVTDKETSRKLNEIIWAMSSEKELPLSRSKVLTAIINEAWERLAVAQSEKA